MNKSNHSDDSNYDERPRYAEEHQNEADDWEIYSDGSDEEDTSIKLENSSVSELKKPADKDERELINVQSSQVEEYGRRQHGYQKNERYDHRAESRREYPIEYDKSKYYSKQGGYKKHQAYTKGYDRYTHGYNERNHHGRGYDKFKNQETPIGEQGNDYDKNNYYQHGGRIKQTSTQQYKTKNSNQQYYDKGNKYYDQNKTHLEVQQSEQIINTNENFTKKSNKSYTKPNFERKRFDDNNYRIDKTEYKKDNYDYQYQKFNKNSVKPGHFNKQMDYHNDRTKKDIDKLEAELVKPVFINSKLTKTQENQLENETNKTEISKRKHSIPITDIFNITPEQIEEKIASAKQDLIDKQINHSLNLKGDYPKVSSNTPNLSIKESTSIDENQTNATSTAPNQSSTQMMTTNTQAQVKPNSTQSISNSSTILPKNEMSYHNNWNTYNLQPTMTPGVYPNIMNMTQQFTMNNYYIHNKLVYSNPQVGNSQITSASNLTSKDITKEFEKLNLDAKEFIPKRKNKEANK